MLTTKGLIQGTYLIQPEVFEDERGLFLEVFNEKKYKKELQIDYKFVQDNYSQSKKDVLRGLHFQKDRPQGKLVRVVRGEVFDVVVDINQESETYGNWQGVILSEENRKQFWIPPGLAHGFLVLSDFADFEYKCTDFYYPEDEVTLLWNDPDLKIDWPSKTPIVSIKDSQGMSLSEIKDL